MKSIRDVKSVTQVGTPEEEFAPSYRTPVSSGALARGGKVKPKKAAKGGKIDGCAQRGKTKGRIV